MVIASGIVKWVTVMVETVWGGEEGKKEKEGEWGGGHYLQ